MEKNFYIAPEIEVFEVQIEQGFAATGDDPKDYGYGGQLGDSWD